MPTKVRGECWYAFTEDEGVLRCERTLYDVEAWWKAHTEAIQTHRANRREGVVWYTAVTPRGEIESIYIVRADRAREMNLKKSQPPLYPHKDKPHELVERIGA